MNLLPMFADYNYTYTTTTTTTQSTGSAPIGLIFGLLAFYLLIILFLFVVPTWKIYRKAGRPGWASIIPIYSTWVLFEIVGYPGWWALLSIIPFVNLFPTVMAIVAYFKLAKLFGRSTAFGVCTILFPFVCLPILGYGKSTFQSNDSGQNAWPSTTPEPPYPTTPTPPSVPQPPNPQPPVNPAMPTSAPASEPVMPNPAPVTPAVPPQPVQPVQPAAPQVVAPTAPDAGTETPPPQNPTITQG